MNARDTLTAYADGRLAASELLRAIVEAADWRVAAAIDGEGNARPRPLPDREGALWLNLFSDLPAQRRFEARYGRPLDRVLVLSGRAVLRGLPDDIAGLNLDPFAPWALHYRRDSFSALRAAAAAGANEQS